MAYFPAIVVLSCNSFLLFVYSFKTDYVPMQVAGFVFAALNALGAVAGIVKR